MIIENCVRAQNVTKVFSEAGKAEPVTVLKGISIDVVPGEMMAIVGPSGSGKSTLLYCLSGLEPCTDGTVSLFGERIGGLSPQQLAHLRQRRVGFVFQAYNLIPSLSAWENVALPLRVGRQKFDRESVDSALAAVGMQDRAKHLPGELSGGQQQRIAIARVLASGPDLVFADEPTGALDTHTSEIVLGLLRAMTSEGRSVVLVNHDLEAASLADRVLVLRDGRIHSEVLAPTPELLLEAIEQAKSLKVETTPKNERQASV